MKQIKIYVDGGSRGNPGSAAAAFVVVKDGKVLAKRGYYLGKRTNNEAEYSSVIYALRWLSKNERNFSSANLLLDSELVAKQLKGQYKMKSKNLMPLLKESRSLEKKISIKITYNNIPREKNRLADGMVNKVLDSEEIIVDEKK